MTMNEIKTHDIRNLAEGLVHYIDSEGVRRRLDDRKLYAFSPGLAEDANEYPKLLGGWQRGQGLRKDLPR